MINLLLGDTKIYQQPLKFLDYNQEIRWFHLENVLFTTGKDYREARREQAGLGNLISDANAVLRGLTSQESYQDMKQSYIVERAVKARGVLEVMFDIVFHSYHAIND